MIEGPQLLEAAKVRLAVLPVVVGPDARERVPSWVVARRSAAALDQLGELSADIGRLRRRLDEGSALRYTADRAADRVEGLTLLFTKTAAERVRDGTPVAEALAQVDREARRVRVVLGDDQQW